MAGLSWIYTTIIIIVVGLVIVIEPFVSSAKEVIVATGATMQAASERAAIADAIFLKFFIIILLF